MSSAHFSVEFAGPSTTIQDDGRPGFMRFGVPRSGPMDRGALALARRMIGNDRAAAVEVSLGGLCLRCVQGEIGFAIAGGGFSVELDGRPLGSWTVGVISSGSRLTIGQGRWGAWTYLVFAGDLVAPSWLGSQATHAPSGLGGGRILSGAGLVVERPSVLEARAGDVAWPAAHLVPERFRVVMGPQEDCFTSDARDALLGDSFRLGAEFDRMGARLQGPPLTISRSLDMLSQPILRGSIQVAGERGPFVLMADHQTTGGYPKIATLISADPDAFSQLRPGDPVRFCAVSAQEAVALARAGHQRRHQAESAVRGADDHPWPSLGAAETG